MARGYSVAVRNAMLDAYESTIGTAPLLRFYSGAMPATAADTTTGTLLASITLPSDWLAGAAKYHKLNRLKDYLNVWGSTNCGAAFRHFATF